MRQISNILLTLILLIITSSQVFSQLRCGAMQRWAAEIKDYPQLIEKRQKIDSLGLLGANTYAPQKRQQAGGGGNFS